MADSSSSSDEEEKAKLKSAAWPSLSHEQVTQKGTKSGTQSQPKKSLRNTDDLEELGDYRNVDATPELKAFIAKKLTSWLDSSIRVVDGQTSGMVTSVAAQDEQDDDFQLFSTSKPGLAAEETQPLRRQQRPLPVSSDSDSEEEKAKLSSVAISYDQILQGSLLPMLRDQQVTSNLLPTNTHSTLTSAGPSQSNPSDRAHDLKSKKHRMRQSGSDGEAECSRGNGRTKKKRKKKKMVADCEVEETVMGTDLPSISKTDKCGKLGLQTSPAGSDNGSRSTLEESKQILKKKRKKQRREKDAAHK